MVVYEGGVFFSNAALGFTKRNPKQRNEATKREAKNGVRPKVNKHHRKFDYRDMNTSEVGMGLLQEYTSQRLLILHG